MAEKKKRIRRSREELLKDPNFRDQSGGNRSRKIDGKTRRQRGVDNRFRTDDRIFRIEKEIEANDRNIDKWRDRLEEIDNSIDRIARFNTKQQELKKAGKIRVASQQNAPNRKPAEAELSTALAKSSRLKSELRELKSRKF